MKKKIYSLSTNNEREKNKTRIEWISNIWIKKKGMCSNQTAYTQHHYRNKKKKTIALTHSLSHTNTDTKKGLWKQHHELTKSNRMYEVIVWFAVMMKKGIWTWQFFFCFPSLSQSIANKRHCVYSTLHITIQLIAFNLCEWVWKCICEP